jgi:molybdate transport system regulatory protein
MKMPASGMNISGSLSLEGYGGNLLGADKILLLEKIGELGSITKAAKAAGVSYKTAWEAVNALNNLSDAPLVARTTGGHGGGGASLTEAGKVLVERFRIIREEHRRFLAGLSERVADIDNIYRFLGRLSLKVSARNVLSGTVTKLAKGGVNAEVSLTLKGGTVITSVVTIDSIDTLGLREGSEAYAIIKASSVMLGIDLENTRMSTRNLICGTVSRIIDGPVSSEVDLETDGGTIISAVITAESRERLGLAEGRPACAVFNASSVILGVT